jgi:riboflavin kinase
MRGESTPSFAAEGTVASGLGRGAQFLAIGWVLRELRTQVGLLPFPGTLNLRISPIEWASLYARRASFVKIDDPSSAGCPGYLRRVVLSANGQAYSSAYLILPEQTIYKDVLEIIAAENLRQKLHLKDGDVVRVEEFQKE